MKGLMATEGEQLQRMQHQAASADLSAPAAEASHAAAARLTQSRSGYSALLPISAGLGILAAALAGLYFKFRRRAPAKADSKDGVAAAVDTASVDGAAVDGMAGTGLERGQNQPPDLVSEPQQPSIQVSEHSAWPDTMPAAPQADDRDDAAEAFAEVFANDHDATHPLLPILTVPATAVRSETTATLPNAAAHAATVNMHVGTVHLRAEPTRLDYNLLDLDLTAQHVQMPSALNENAVFKERRTNLTDVLKLAIEREPDRHDLRMKLLELYYSAASTNRRAFLDAVQKMARDRDHLQGGQWDKIAFMGRQIAAENPLFAEESASDDLADCA
jgi:hypothetical protein